MKTTLTAFRRKTLILLLLFTVMGLALKQNTLMAQIDCAGTLMYGIWNDSINSTNNTPSEIRSINYVTGAVGPLVGGMTYTITRTQGTNTFYGSAGLGLDPINKNFFVMTQMGSSSAQAIRKDIMAIVPGSAPVVIATTPNSATANVAEEETVRIVL